MKKLKLLFVSVIVLISVNCAKAQVTFPNVNTNYLNTLTIIQNFLLTNVTFLSNLQFAVLDPITNVWVGPTNTYDLSIKKQMYASYTSMSITGFAGLLTNAMSSSVLDISNLSGTNETFAVLGNITTDDGLRVYTITNGTKRAFSLRYTPDGPQTNVVTRTMF